MTQTIHPPRRRAPRGRRGLAAAAETIGIPTDVLRAALHDGNTIAQVAHDHGVMAEDVIGALVEEFRLRLAAEVAAGRVTSQDAAVLISTAPRGFISLVTGVTL